MLNKVACSVKPSFSLQNDITLLESNAVYDECRDNLIAVWIDSQRPIYFDNDAVSLRVISDAEIVATSDPLIVSLFTDEQRQIAGNSFLKHNSSPSTNFSDDDMLSYGLPSGSLSGSAAAKYIKSRLKSLYNEAKHGNFENHGSN